MELFGSRGSAGAAQLAHLHLKTWDSSVALRIALQRSLDVSNQIPVFKSDTEKYMGGIDSEELCGCLSELISLLEMQLPLSREGGTKKRKLDTASADSGQIWEHLESIQSEMRSNWIPVVDKWHARLNYGSEKSKSKLKILRTTIWDQIDRALSDDTLVVEKSRPLLMSSKRLHKPGNEHSPATARDEEVYDDTHFYSMLLKMLIQANISSANITEGDAEWTALQNFRKQNQRLDVDRRASKGRKIRYVAHSKLQNFMFPVQRGIADTENEFSLASSSLFQ